jgi:predicted nucleic acid-binding Zn ribbon protein
MIGKIPYKKCSECGKAIRYYNKTGVCSNCQNLKNYVSKLKGKSKRKKKDGLGNRFAVLYGQELKGKPERNSQISK